MKAIYFLGIFVLTGTMSYGQKNACKLLKGKDETGKEMNFVVAPTKIGGFYVGKKSDNFIISYSTKAGYLLVIDDRDQTQLKIDSVQFYFSDATMLTLPAKGIGKIKNEVKLRNVFDFTQFEVALDQKAVDKFSSVALREFQVRGDKDSDYHDEVVPKNQEKLTTAFACFK